MKEMGYIYAVVCKWLEGSLDAETAKEKIRRKVLAGYKPPRPGQGGREGLH